MQYKGNPNKSKQEKKISAVISGGAKLKKTGKVEKASKIFLEEDIRSVASFIFNDVLVPTTKKLLYDIVTNALGISLWGENGANKQSTVNAGKVSYGSYYSSRSSNNERYIRNAGKNNEFDYDKIIFNTAVDAECVLDTMYETLDKYGMVSVNDLYEMASITSTNYAADRYGWEDLHGSRVVKTLDGWALKLPRPRPLR